MLALLRWLDLKRSTPLHLSLLILAVIAAARVASPRTPLWVLAALGAAAAFLALVAMERGNKPSRYAVVPDFGASVPPLPPLEFHPSLQPREACVRPVPRQPQPAGTPFYLRASPPQIRAPLPLAAAASQLRAAHAAYAHVGLGGFPEQPAPVGVHGCDGRGGRTRGSGRRRARRGRRGQRFCARRVAATSCDGWRRRWRRWRRGGCALAHGGGRRGGARWLTQPPRLPGAQRGQA